MKTSKYRLTGYLFSAIMCLGITFIFIGATTQKQKEKHRTNTFDEKLIYLQTAEPDTSDKYIKEEVAIETPVAKQDETAKKNFIIPTALKDQNSNDKKKKNKIRVNTDVFYNKAKSSGLIPKDMGKDEFVKLYPCGIDTTSIPGDIFHKTPKGPEANKSNETIQSEEHIITFIDPIIDKILDPFKSNKQEYDLVREKLFNLIEGINKLNEIKGTEPYDNYKEQLSYYVQEAINVGINIIYFKNILFIDFF